VRGLARVPAAAAGTLSLAEPLTASLLGIVALGERPSAAGAAGAVLLVAGLALAALAGYSSGRPAAAAIPGRSLST
jgi:DME family drug/metabolite transporter